MTRIASLALALPENRLTQFEARDVARRALGPHRLLDAFDTSGVEARHLAFPPDYYLQERGFAERNRDWVRKALELGETCAQGALALAGCEAPDIDHFFLVTTTGLATPSVDALLAPRLGLRPDVERNPLFGIGCAGGAAALGRAARTLRHRPGRRALVLSVELCGQTFRKSDRSSANYVGAALFGDGAAAAVLDGGPGRPQVIAEGSELFPGTEDVMGWEFEDGGPRLVLTAEVPRTLHQRAFPAIRNFLSGQGVDLEDVRHFILHPGGRRVLEAYADGLGLTAEQLRPSRDCLRTKGNLSSAAVLFILESIEAQAGDLGLVAAVGPGFAIEMCLLRW